MGAPTASRPGITTIVVADGDAAWLRHTLRSVGEQEGVADHRCIVIHDAALSDDFAAGAPVITEVVAAHRDELRERALDAARGAVTDLVALTCTTDYWCRTDKLARQAAALHDDPDASACFHPVIMRWSDDLRVMPHADWRRSGVVDADDVMRALPWTSLLVRTGALADAQAADAACDLFGVRIRLGRAGVAFEPHPMVVRQMTLQRSALPGTPLDRLEAAHALKMKWRRPDDHRLLGQPTTFVQDWLAAIESGLVLPAEIALAEWGRRTTAGQLGEARDARTRLEQQMAALEGEARDARARLEQQMAALEGDNAALREHLAMATTDLEQIMSSRTWRSTEWARRLSRGVTRGNARRH